MRITNPPSTAAVVKKLSFTGQSANVAQTTLFTPAVTGFYSITCYAVVTQAATTSSTLPNGQLFYTDPDTSQAVGPFSINVTSTGNTAGTTAVGAGATEKTIYAAAGQPVSVRTNGYLSSGATAMVYNCYFVATRVA